MTESSSAKKALTSLSQKLRPSAEPATTRAPPTITERVRGGGGADETASTLNYIVNQPWFLPVLAGLTTVIFITSHTLLRGVPGDVNPVRDPGAVRKNNMSYRGGSSAAPTPEFDSLGVLSPTTQTMGHYVPRLPELSPTQGPVRDGVVTV
eukprot:CAMPEP_0172508254 /NCGR_PEP_ID=MMETSP1066-20121228/210605_1 /TAXON_ID=671091 /ORGANISM="Coscinodiscus wailesii, Strain CCMP2513" /LENGTH=150 /DNA_ID=CAMNT_0013286161 /DNA_START=109 /DNA_END=558 /DNA_ORIENTATION=+